MTERTVPPTPGPPPDAGVARASARPRSALGALLARLGGGARRRVGAAVGARAGELGRQVVGLGQRRIAPRRIAAWVLAAIAVLLPSAAWGVATASVQGSLGPHTARYDVTLDGEVTVDLGPLGTLVIDSPLPLTLGARVVVQEIPEDVTSIDAATTLESLAGALEEYVAFFTGPEATVELAARALVADAARRALLAAGVLTAVLLGLRLLLGRERRAELADVGRAHRTALVGAAAVVVLVGTALAGGGPLGTGPDDERRASAVFDDTPLEGARITGRLAGVIDTYGGQAVDAWRENEQFYAAAVDSVQAAWQARAEADQRLIDIRRRLGILPTAPPAVPAEATLTGPGVGTGDGGAGEGEGDGATGDGGEGDAAPSAPVTASPPSPSRSDGDHGDDGDDGEGDDEEQGTPELVTLLVVSDLHCNVGMADVIGTVAELSGAQVVVNAGDTTVNGTAVESYCVEAFADALPEGITTVVSDGNHDSGETAHQEDAAGWVVLDGEVVEVAGLRILGDADPRATRIGSGTSFVGEETVADLAARLADVACSDDDGVDLLLVHDPFAGVPTLTAGCAPAQVSGHYHRREGPVRAGSGTRFTSSSSAGARLGQATIGPLAGDAELTVLRFDPEARRITDYRLVIVHRDATATVTAPLIWPNTSPRMTPDSPLR